MREGGRACSCQLTTWCSCASSSHHHHSMLTWSFISMRRTTLQAAAEIVKAGGIRGLWQGTGPSVLRVGAGAGVHFVLLEQVKAMLLAAPASGPVETLTAAGAALAGGAHVGRCWRRLWLVYGTQGCKMELPLGQHPLWGVHEARACCFIPSLNAWDVCGCMQRFPDQACPVFPSDPTPPYPSTHPTLACAGLSRAAAAVLLCPITVVKTRMEYATDDVSVPRYRNTAHALASIARQEGPRGLFRGVLPTVLTNAPFSGLYYMFYTQLKVGGGRGGVRGLPRRRAGSWAGSTGCKGAGC